MSPRSPGEHPPVGTTIQEHDLDQRREQLADDQDLQPVSGTITVRAADIDEAPRQRETWRDWLPEDAPEPKLYTRSEIAEKASSIDPVTGDDIRYWEYQGVLPRSIRRRYAGATRAVYPDWYASLAREVRVLQRQGLTLEEIKPKIRERFRTGRFLMLARQLIGGYYPQPSPSPELEEQLDRLAQELGKRLGSPPAHIEVSITLENGNGETYNFRVTPDNDSNLK